jgi:hypothetical protein
MKVVIPSGQIGFVFAGDAFRASIAGAALYGEAERDDCSRIRPTEPWRADRRHHGPPAGAPDHDRERDRRRVGAALVALALRHRGKQHRHRATKALAALRHGGGRCVAQSLYTRPLWAPLCAQVDKRRSVL